MMARLIITAHLLEFGIYFVSSSVSLRNESVVITLAPKLTSYDEVSKFSKSILVLVRPLSVFKNSHIYFRLTQVRLPYEIL